MKNPGSHRSRLVSYPDRARSQPLDRFTALGLINCGGTLYRAGAHCLGKEIVLILAHRSRWSVHMYMRALVVGSTSAGTWRKKIRISQLLAWWARRWIQFLNKMGKFVLGTMIFLRGIFSKIKFYLQNQILKRIFWIYGLSAFKGLRKIIYLIKF